MPKALKAEELDESMRAARSDVNAEFHDDWIDYFYTNRGRLYKKSVNVNGRTLWFVRVKRK